jgi:hypothetical protein
LGEDEFDKRKVLFVAKGPFPLPLGVGEKFCSFEN